MKDKHIDDKWGVVDLRLGGVVVDPAGTLHSLWDVPASTHVIIIPSRPPHMAFDNTHSSLSVVGVNSELSVQFLVQYRGGGGTLKAWQYRSTCCNIQTHTGTIPAVGVLRTLKPWSMWTPAQRWRVSHQNGSWSSACRRQYSVQQPRPPETIEQSPLRHKRNTNVNVRADFTSYRSLRRDCLLYLYVSITYLLMWQRILQCCSRWPPRQSRHAGMCTEWLWSPRWPWRGRPRPGWAGRSSGASSASCASLSQRGWGSWPGRQWRWGTACTQLKVSTSRALPGSTEGIQMGCGPPQSC